MPPPTAPVVTVGGKTVTAGDNTYKVTWTPQDGKPSFQITFAPAYLTGLASAEVNERAVTVNTAQPSQTMR